MSRFACGVMRVARAESHELPVDYVRIARSSKQATSALRELQPPCQNTPARQRELIGMTAHVAAVSQAPILLTTCLYGGPAKVVHQPTLRHRRVTGLVVIMDKGC